MRKWLIWSTLLLFALTLSGCYVGELPSCQPYLQSDSNGGLVYETIEWSVGSAMPGQWQQANPAFLQAAIQVIADSEEITEIESYISDTATQTLKRLDYASEFAVIGFVGPTSGTAFCLTGLVRQDNAISVRSLSINVGYGPAAEQFPYHLIRVQKEGTWDDIFTFDLALTKYARNYSDGNPFKYPIKIDIGVVTSVSQFIP